MTGLEIIVMTAGIILLFSSFFIPGKGERGSISVPDEEMEAAIRRLKEAAGFQEEELRKKVKNIIENDTIEIISELEEDMSRLSNEKIMAIDEFSNQVLEKIENNNQEVIFLYDMFQKKEEEMKSTMNKMEQTRRENKELFDRLEELKKAKARVNAKKNAEAGKTDQFPQTVQTVHTAQTVENISGRNKKEAEKTAAVNSEGGKNTTFCDNSLELSEGEATDELTETQKKEQILEMYHQNKSIKEISKSLSMGQGEVKLIIDLYGR